MGAHDGSDDATRRRADDGDVRRACAPSWQIDRGRADAVVLDGLAVVLAGRWDDDEPGSPWRVALYVDERDDDAQQRVLADIFLGRAGGTTVANYAKAIGEVYCVRTAHIRLDHAPGGRRIDVDDCVTGRALEPVAVDTPVSCGIPGHDRPGTEVLCETLRVDEPPLRWEERALWIRHGLRLPIGPGAMSTVGSVLTAVGDITLVRLPTVTVGRGAGIHLKLEWFNPTGSDKDRMALAMIQGAERRGALEPGMTLSVNIA